MGKRGPGQGPIRHGTVSGWQVEQNRGTGHCEACKAAKNSGNRARYTAGRCVPGLGWPIGQGRASRGAGGEAS